MPFSSMPYAFQVENSSSSITHRLARILQLTQCVLVRQAAMLLQDVITKCDSMCLNYVALHLRELYRLLTACSYYLIPL